MIFLVISVGYVRCAHTVTVIILSQIIDVTKTYRFVTEAVTLPVIRYMSRILLWEEQG